MKNKQKGAISGLLAGLVFGLVSGGMIFIPEAEPEKDELESARELSELTDAFGQATAAGIVRNNCAEDLLWLLRVGETNWTDAWCAQHYNHLTTNRTFGE